MDFIQNCPKMNRTTPVVSNPGKNCEKAKAAIQVAKGRTSWWNDAVFPWLHLAKSNANSAVSLAANARLQFDCSSVRSGSDGLQRLGLVQSAHKWHLLGETLRDPLRKLSWQTCNMCSMCVCACGICVKSHGVACSLLILNNFATTIRYQPGTNPWSTITLQWDNG